MRMYMQHKIDTFTVNILFTVKVFEYNVLEKLYTKCNKLEQIVY